MKKSMIIFLASIVLPMTASGQKRYFIDASSAMTAPEAGHFRMGDPGPAGKEIRVNSRYLTIGGIPVIPVMGEVHFSRVKRQYWEDVVLKMKAGGINVVATYLFWNQHEEIEGQFCWEGNKDLRAFVKLCGTHGMYVYPRLGPWSHGEARNGGTPDWVLRKQYLEDRSNDPVYQAHVKRYFGEIAGQLEGLLYRDGGPVIGIQLENEYWWAREGEPHILWLKQTAVEAGIDVPLYTVTGWGDGSVPPFEVVPLWGGYADEPWIQNIKKHVLPSNFKFDAFRDSEHIGNDQVEREGQYMSYERYPYFTCEMGVGIQNTYHRRLSIGRIDGLGMMIARVGSGSNLLGYYMFAGGTHPRGLLHPTEEEQEETGYWSRVPPKSYDFQAAIRESGQLGPSFPQVKKLHYFIHEAGTILAPMNPVLGKSPVDDLQYAVRSDNHSGFLFGINYCRFLPRQERKNVQFDVKFDNETIGFPQEGITIPDSALFIWPLNYDMDGVLLKYATAQLLTRIGDTYVFFRNRDIRPEFAFDAGTVEEAIVSAGRAVKRDGRIVVSDLRPGTDCRISLLRKEGGPVRVVLLTGEQADRSWVLDGTPGRRFFLSDACLVGNRGRIFASGDGEALFVSEWMEGGFKEMVFPVDEPGRNGNGDRITGGITLTPHPLFANAEWLESANFTGIPDHMVRYHRFFFKEFSLGNPSPVRKATLYIFPESGCTANLNERWVRQNILPGKVNAVDLTGYVQKGNNLLFLDFPYTEGQKQFAARLVVDYSNYDRVEFLTDATWLQTDIYTHPSTMRPYDRPGPSTRVPEPEWAANLSSGDFTEWDIRVPRNLENGYESYLTIRYLGDRAELYNGHVLCADDFNAHTPWTIGLDRLIPSAAGKSLRLVIHSLEADSKIYFDIPPPEGGYGTAEIVSWNDWTENLVEIGEL